MGAGRLVLVARGVVPGAAGEPNDAGRTASVTDTPAKQAPRALKTRTTSPSPMPRLLASSGLIANVSRPAILPRTLTGPASIWLCRRWLPAAKPLRGFDPSRMRRAVIIGEPGNPVGIDLDPPGGSAQHQGQRRAGEIR